MKEMFHQVFEKRPRVPYLVITCSQMAIGFTIFVLGLSVHNTTPQYRVGGFWAGLLSLLLGIYRSGVLVARMVPNQRSKIERYKSNLAMIMMIFSTLCFIASVCAAITDIIAAFLLQQVDFTYCAYTDVSTLSPCANPECSSVRFPRNTCYCCQIMEGLKHDCDVTLLTGRQYYYSEVDSCFDIAIWLRVKLAILVILHIVNAVFDIASLCKTSPTISTTNKTFKISNTRQQKKNADRQSKRRTKLGNTSHQMENEDEEMEEELLAEEENMNRIMGSISTDSML